MNRHVWTIPLLLCVLSASVTSCTSASRPTLPKAICGTQIDPKLTRPLVDSATDLHEFSRVDRSQAISAPCSLLSGDEEIANLHFWWADGPVDFTYMTQNAGSASRVSSARDISFKYKAAVGTDGAIAASPCKTHGGNYFTLTLQLPRIELGDQSHRKDIEAFMRAYFPATLRTLGCERPGAAGEDGLSRGPERGQR
ncbi:hypothetical protein [Streptomyces sp. NPDC005573]|uniref:hypothetical protein n=1 Tax=Streptomyces sp. NPDC005573 TaxID=3156890 RepID=UPI0033A8B340